jgi:hypothetical protein
MTDPQQAFRGALANPLQVLSQRGGLLFGRDQAPVFFPKGFLQAGQRQRWWPWREVPFLTQLVVWQCGQFMPNPSYDHEPYQYLFSNPQG